MEINFRKLLLLSLSLSSINLFSELAYVMNFSNRIYSFDTNYLSTPATSYPYPGACYGIAFSPDGNTVYSSNAASGDVYSFPSNNPYTLTPLGTGLIAPENIAISSDGTYGIAIETFTTREIYFFPIHGSSHTAVRLTPTNSTITTPAYIAINGLYAFVGDVNGDIYRVTFTSTTYNATLIQSLGNNDLAGLAVSNDGYLYISGYVNPKVSRVPLSNQTTTPALLATLVDDTEGLAVSGDGKTVYCTSFNEGIYAIPTNEGLPTTNFTRLTALNITNAVGITIAPAISPPQGLTGTQKKNNFGLAFENVNLLNWQPSLTNRVTGYYVYRNGTLIATLNASTLSYQDSNIQRGVVTTYTVSAFDAGNNTSSQVSVTIN
jgi:hypothetical protein